MSYQAFLQARAQLADDGGFAPVWMPDFLFPFQSHLTEWAIRKGRGAEIADCGLGKTPMQLVWSENVVRKTNGRVLILTPLAVSAQTVREAEKFGIEAHKSSDGKPARNITVTNYERLHLFDPEDFAGVVCDESSILKNFDGTRRAQITEFMRTRPYRLLCTATAAPNDYIEFGTASEALGQLGYMDMLSKFFKNDQNSNHPNRQWAGGGKWRFRGHAERDFWRWVCSWARAIRRPSDLGFDDGPFVLPDLVTREHVVTTRTRKEGMLFDLPAVTLEEQRDERRRTIRERCEMAAALVQERGKSSVSWCHLNDEGDLLARLIPGAVQVSDSDSDEEKEEKFGGFASGQIEKIVTKDSIGGCDCIDGMEKLAPNSIHFSIYSPPFRGLYNYSSSDRDLSNCRDYPEFLEHYGYVVREIQRVTLPGRLSAVHCTDVPDSCNLGGGLTDFPGDMIRLHAANGFRFVGRHHVWKEPLGVRNRTMAKGLAHRQIVDDSSLVDVASADQLVLFRKRGENPIPIAHPVGLLEYAGERKIPAELLAYRGWTGKQTENRYSHWIWRQYASSFWDDVRIDRVLPYKESKDPEDERHVHPLQLDVIERAIVLRSNPGEIVLTPFAGVGSEVYQAVKSGRKGVGWELKASYYRQAVRNVELADHPDDTAQESLVMGHNSTNA